MGITSIIAIMVVLILSVFASLSIITSKGDLNLSLKTKDSITDFYKADYEAETIRNDAYTIVKDGGNLDKLIDAHKDYEIAILDGGSGAKLIQYSVQVDDVRALNVELRVAKSKVEVNKWAVEASTDWEPDNTLQLIH